MTRPFALWVFFQYFELLSSFELLKIYLPVPVPKKLWGLSCFSTMNVTRH